MGIVVQLVLGDHIEAIAIGFGPLQERPFIGGPAGERIIAGVAIDEGPFDGVIARRPGLFRPHLVDTARRTARQPDLATRPWPQRRQMRRATARQSGIGAEIMIGAAPVVIGRPCRGRRHQRQRAFAALARAIDEQMMPDDLALRGGLVADFHEIAAAHEIVRQRPAQECRPAAAGFIHPVRHRAELRIPDARTEHHGAIAGIAADGQRHLGDRGRQMQRDSVTGAVSPAIRIAPRGLLAIGRRDLDPHLARAAARSRNDRGQAIATRALAARIVGIRNGHDELQR